MMESDPPSADEKEPFEKDPPSADEKEHAEKILALACGNAGSGNSGLVHFISVGLIFCTLSF